MRQISDCVRIGIGCVIAAWLGGCQPKATPPEPPAMVSRAELFVGTPITGPLAGKADVALSAASMVRVQWIALQRLPADALAPIDAQSRLIIAANADATLPATGQLTRDIRFAAGDAAATFIDRLNAGELGPWSHIAADARLAAPGTTLRFTLDRAGEGQAIRPPLWLLYSPAEQAPATTQPSRPVIAVQVAQPPGEDAASALPITETAILDTGRLADDLFVIARPIDTGQSPWAVIAAIAAVDPAPGDPAVADALQVAIDQATGHAASLAHQPPGDAPTVRGALAALRSNSSRRPAMLLLTSLTHARIASDMALVADEMQLLHFAVRTRQFADVETLPELPALQWFLDRTALQIMCQAAEQEALSPELQAVLTLHAGDVARRPDAIVELLSQVNSSEALAERLIAENFIALEDTSPAARIRAFDWLSAQGRAPADFDPLADARSRRAAIDRAMTQMGGQP